MKRTHFSELSIWRFSTYIRKTKYVENLEIDNSLKCVLFIKASGQITRGIFFFENLTYFFIPWSGRKYSHINSYNSAMTVITQDDHLPAGAWAAYALHGLIFLILETVAADRERGFFS